jgi:hypothetical protein
MDTWVEARSDQKTIPGSVVQTVQGALINAVSFTTANSWTSVGLSASITPKFPTSKVLISVHIGVGANAAGDNYDSAFGLFRNGTQIALPAANSQLSSFLPFGVRGFSQYEMTTVSNSYLDSPATTSLMTYDVRAFSTNTNAKYINRTGSDAVGNGDNRMISTITLMEVAQ